MSYCRKLMKKSMLPNFISAFLIFGYSCISSLIISQRPFRDFVPAIIFAIVCTLIMQLFLFPCITRLIFTGMQRRLNQFATEEITEKSRTRLFEDLMLNPFINSMSTFFLFVIDSVLVYLFYLKQVHLSYIPATIEFVLCIYGDIFSALFAYGYTNKICSDYAVELVHRGIDKKYVMEKKHFGINLNGQLTVYCVLPLILTAIIVNIVVAGSFMTAPFTGFVTSSTPVVHILNMGFVCTVNSIVQTAMILFFYKRIKESNRKMSSILENMDSQDITKASYVDTDIEDEVGFTHYLANNMLMLLQETLRKFEETGNQINENSINLSHISTESNATYLEQSSGTTEIVASMKNTTERAHQVKDTIAEVAKLAKDTESDVQNGNQVLGHYYENIKHIEEHNNETIRGITDLSAKINKIWEVVTMINSIADQTKIIAFNAELESSGIQQKGSNFKNVSNEIRRLANSTMDSTRDIKERINVIQDSSEQLKSSLEETLPLIKSGRLMVEELKKNFDHILSSTNKNAESAGSVSGLVVEQTSAFEQISNTLQQINASLQNFEEAAATISRTSEQMQKSAEELGKISSKGAVNE